MNTPDVTSWSPERVAILGVGLLGGSVALATKRRWPACHVIGTSRKSATRQMLVSEGIVDHATDSIREAVASSDLVVVAAPVLRIAAMLGEVAANCHDKAIITDVGSTKHSIVAAAERDAKTKALFVGAHPIAGSEKTGAANSSGELFNGKVTIVTPTEFTDTARTGKVCDFWTALGSRVICMTPVEHDEALAAASHMPHLASAALAQTLPPEFREIVGSGFRDATRIAAGDPQMWREIVEANAAATLTQIKRLGDTLSLYEQAIEAEDWDQVESLFAAAQAAKLAIGR